MKAPILALLTVILGSTVLHGQDYTNFIRQIQFPTGVEWDVPVEAAGQQLSPLPVDNGGARFELWTVKNSPLQSYLLDSQFVGSYVPTAQVTIRSEDPYSIIPRTRADRPFFVDITIGGLLNGPTDPPASKQVTLRRHVQSYGPGGTGINLDRDQAILLSEATIAENGLTTLSYAINAVPGADRTKVRGEERFSIFSLEDYQAPEEQITSRYIQIWPMAEASITGLVADMLIKSAMPTVTLTLEDLYPNSQTYAQVYPGDPVLGTEGTIVPGSALVVNDTVPKNATLTLSDWDEAFSGDGRWTLELLTVTPFGIDRLAYLSFDLDRTIRINGSVTSLD